MQFSNSCFFRLSSPSRLAALLCLKPVQLYGLVDEHRSHNYLQFDHDGRWIQTPLPTLKKAQRRIHALLARLAPPDYIFSAYKGRSAITNAAAHDGDEQMVKLDIRHFYPSSNGWLVNQMFRRDFECAPNIASILWKLCTIQSATDPRKTHLPTGGVTSPILAFLAYRPMFDELKRLANDNSLNFSVFADDITFSGAAANEKILSEARQILRKHGLVSHSKKEKFWSRKHSHKIVTGALVTPKGLRVPLARKKNIKELQRLLAEETSPTIQAKLYQKLCGALASAGQIEPRFAVGARCALKEWRSKTEVWDAYLRSSRNR